MKITRQKKVKKTLSFYANNFKFREPYQVLVEGTFAYAALKNKVQLKEQIPNYFQSEVKFLTTRCLIIELEQLAQQSRKLEGATKIIKQFPIHQCGHKKPVIGSKCVRDMLSDNNSARYIVATQDRALQEQVRNTPATPLLYLHVQTPTLEPASEADQHYAKELRDKLTMSSETEEKLRKMKENVGIVEKTELKVKKKRKKGGPNPLSCLKKKKKAQQNQTNLVKKSEDGKVKKPPRKKIKIPAHVKEELVKQIIHEKHAQEKM